MNYEWQRDNILWLKLTKLFLKTKQFKKWSEKKIEKIEISENIHIHEWVKVKTKTKRNNNEK